jgi:uncharacterized protein (TIGR03086 family)
MGKAAGMTDAALTDPQQRDDVDRLESAVGVTADVVAGVRRDQLTRPTPCPDYDVGQLVDHLVGFATSFADRANGVDPAADATTVTAGDDPVGEYRAQTRRLVDGYRSGAGGEQAAPVGIALMEAIAHGWDLARATGQPAPYPDDAVDAALGFGRGVLEPKYRGGDRPFGVEVDVPEGAPVLERFVGFMGRDPEWSPAG